MKKHLINTCSVALFSLHCLGASGPGAQAKDFQHLVVKEGMLVTTHGLKLTMKADAHYKVAKPKHRVATFKNGNTFEISLSAFISPKAAIMVHAESDANAKGAANYSNKPKVNWPNDTFRSNGPACIEVAKEDVAHEHDLAWLRTNGFEPSGKLLFSQYFSTTNDFNHEIVLSLIIPVKSCQDDAAQKMALQAVKQSIEVDPMN